MAFDIIHISDVHFQGIMTVDWIDRDKIISKIRKDEKLQADCIIISGDLFTKGSLSADAARECQDFIGRLKGASAKKISLQGREQEILPFVLVVPGNHDLDRFARLEIAGAYNEFVMRSNLVNSAAEAMSNNNLYRIPDEHAKLFYEFPFSAFQRLSQEIGSHSFCNPDAALTAENYELQIHEIPLQQGDEASGKVRFVLLNTALFAGQSLSYDEFQKRRFDKARKHKEKNEAGETVDAARLALQIAQEETAYEKYGCLIVDEEKFDSGSARLGLSSTGVNALRQSSIDNANHGIVCTIFVGHHGLEFLSTNTFKAICEAMAYFHPNANDEGIYLCGHAHRLQHSEHMTPNNCNLENIHQIQAGVLFGAEDGFSEYGINHIQINYNNNANQTEITSTAYFRNKNHSQKDEWYQEELFTTVLHNINLRQIPTLPPDIEQIKKINPEKGAVYSDTDIKYDVDVKINPIDKAESAPADRSDDKEHPNECHDVPPTVAPPGKEPVKKPVDQDKSDEEGVSQSSRVKALSTSLLGKW